MSVTSGDNEVIANVSRDILNIKIADDMTMSRVLDEFFDIMRQYGIKEGTKTEIGIESSNFEWTMCYQLFLSVINNYFEFKFIFNNSLPEDLRHY